MMLLKLLGVLSCFLLVSTQSQAAPRKSQFPVASPLQNASEFSACKWDRVAGARFSISSFTCGPEQGDLRLIADDDVPGFWLTANDSSRVLAIRLFTKGHRTPITAILPTLRAASKGPQSATCILVRATVKGQELTGTKRYVLQPDGPALKAWESAQDRGEAADEPCGPLGVAIVGERYFEVMPGHSDVDIFVNMGSEIQPFDPATIRRAIKP